MGLALELLHNAERKRLGKRSLRGVVELVRIGG